MRDGEDRPDGPGAADAHPHGVVREVVGHPRHTGRFWFDFAAASSAILISVVSLYVAIGGERTQRELLAANAWPFLQLDEKIQHNGVDQIRVRDEGVGPAKVYAFEVRYRGVPVRDAADLLARCCGVRPDRAGRLLPQVSFSDGDVASNVIRPDGDVPMMGLSRDGSDPAVFQAFTAALPDLTMRACYCSILDRCWVSDLHTLQPEPVRACRPSTAGWMIRNGR